MMGELKGKDFGDPQEKPKKEVETLVEVDNFDDLYSLLEKKQPNEQAKEKIKNAIEKARKIVGAFINKKDAPPKFEKLLENRKSPIALLKKELQKKIVEILEKETLEDQEIVEANTEMLGKDMIKLLNNESQGAREGQLKLMEKIISSWAPMA